MADPDRGLLELHECSALSAFIDKFEIIVGDRRWGVA